MRLLATCLAFGLGSVAAAQSPLSTFFAGNNFVYQNSGQMFFDLVVNTTVTVHAVETNSASAIGQVGNVELWLTNPGFSTFLGNELTASRWTQVATGACTSAGFNQPSIACLSPSVVLQPGSYGVAVRHINLMPYYTNGNGSVVPGGGGPATNQYHATAEMTLLAGAGQAVPFGSVANVPRVWNGRLVYNVGTTAAACSPLPSANTAYGPGCYREQSSFYEFLSAVEAAALAGTSLTMVPTGVGYTLITGVASYVAPSAAATTLTGFFPDADDGVLAVTLPAPFPVPGGVVNQLWVDCNGMVSTGDNSAAFSAATPNWFPRVAGMLNLPNTTWFCWHDYNQTEGGSGQIKTELVGSLFCITWDDVESYPFVANKSTVQMQFDLASGLVSLVLQSITPVSEVLFASDYHIVGYSPGGANLDPGENRIADVVGLLLGPGPEQLPLSLTAAPRPVVGNAVRFTTGNETTNPGFGVHMLAFADLGPFSPVGLDLGFLGAPGCVLNVDFTTGYQNLIGNLPGFSMDVTVPVPLTASLAGAEGFSQSLWFDAAANVAGLITSNAVRSRIGTW